jgi:hypothetical protein
MLQSIALQVRRCNHQINEHWSAKLHPHHKRIKLQPVGWQSIAGNGYLQMQRLLRLKQHSPSQTL